MIRALNLLHAVERCFEQHVPGTDLFVKGPLGITLLQAQFEKVDIGVVYVGIRYRRFRAIFSMSLRLNNWLFRFA